MNPDYSLLIAAAPACLLAVGLVPSRWANRHVFALRRAAMWASWSAFGVALVSAAALAAYGPFSRFLRARERSAACQPGCLFR